MKLIPAVSLTLATLTLASPALAHTGVSAGGLGDGFLHPILGLDHLLAMVAVGLWAAQRGGNLWLLPGCFLAAMAVGAGLALTGVELPLVELGIGGSVVILGAAVALAARVPAAAAGAIVAGFALFHGHAHGAEMPDLASPGLYGAGFLVATALLHGLGVLGGKAALRLTGPMLRLAGAAVAVTGGVLMV